MAGRRFAAAAGEALVGQENRAVTPGPGLDRDLQRTDRDQGCEGKEVAMRKRLTAQVCDGGRKAPESSPAGSHGGGGLC